MKLSSGNSSGAQEWAAYGPVPDEEKVALVHQAQAHTHSLFFLPIQAYLMQISNHLHGPYMFFYLFFIIFFTLRVSLCVSERYCK